MIGRGLFLLTVFSNCVLSLPVTSSQLENEDVEVMKCIVEALADVLSRPRLTPVSQECLITLKTDDRLVAILRHHNFLRELQEIAVQGDQERAKLQGYTDAPAPTTQAPQTTDDSGDRSMLEALGGPGERSILSQRKRTENGDGREEKDESAEDGGSPGESEAAEVQVKRGKNEAEKREEEADEEEHNETPADSEEISKEQKKMAKKGDGSDEDRNASRNKSKQKKSEEENEEEKNKRSSLSSEKHMGKEEEEEEEKASKSGSRKSLKTKRAKFLHLKKKAVGKEEQEHEVPHHSKEVMVEEMEEERKKKGVQRSPEEKELQMMARRAPEERRGMEEEGSASRKPEEPEIESLAAIESELENVAQKLHELRRG